MISLPEVGSLFCFFPDSKMIARDAAGFVSFSLQLRIIESDNEHAKRDIERGRERESGRCLTICPGGEQNMPYDAVVRVLAPIVELGTSTMPLPFENRFWGSFLRSVAGLKWRGKANRGRRAVMGKWVASGGGECPRQRSLSWSCAVKEHREMRRPVFCRSSGRHQLSRLLYFERTGRNDVLLQYLFLGDNFPERRARSCESFCTSRGRDKRKESFESFLSSVICALAMDSNGWGEPSMQSGNLWRRSRICSCNLCFDVELLAFRWTNPGSRSHQTSRSYIDES